MNNTLFIDSSATISVNAGNLRLTTISCPNCSSGGITRNHAAGKVTTKDKFQYGIFESRIYFPRKEGTSAYFQLRGGNGVPCSQGGLYENEINIANSWWRDFYPNYHLSHTVRHYHTGTDCLEDYWRVNWYSYENSNSTYHTYKCIWTPSFLRYYLDDNLIHEALNTGSSCPDCSQEWFPEYQLHLSFYQILNTDVLLYIEIPQTTYIDYVSVKRFFATPEISCPNVICSSDSAIMDVDLSADSITWSLTPTNLFSGTTQGTDKTAAITTATGASGQGKITYTFKMPSGETFTAEKNFWVGKPVISGISGPTTTPNNQWASFTAQLQSDLSSPTDYNWILNPLNGNMIYDYGATCDVAFYNSGYYQIVVQAKNTCPDWGPYYVGNVEVYDDDYIAISPNPTTGETTLSIESTSKENSVNMNEEWDLEIYDQIQTLKEKKTKLKGNEYKIQTAGWKEGVYFVRVKYKDEILTGQLVVKQ